MISKVRLIIYARINEYFLFSITIGVNTGLFTPDVAFKGPVKDQIKLLEDPSLQFISVITGIVDEIGKKIIYGELAGVQKKVTNRVCI